MDSLNTIIFLKQHKYWYYKQTLHSFKINYFDSFEIRHIYFK